MKFDWQNLKKWFLTERRDLPWRQNPGPYAVWVSEVMLQQTQVAVVIPYFLKWMKRFPTIEKLAVASVDEVIKLWEGLGYYSRARNLHEGARFVLSEYGGNLPDCPKKLHKIKGLGPYTVGAILSFAFHKRAAAVDGNVIRVIARYFMLEDDISKPKAVKIIQELVQELLPDKEHWLANEGLIELGATVCKKVPKCIQCPLHQSCRSFACGEVAKYPKKSGKISVTILNRCVAVICSGDSFLVRKGAAGNIMADLYEFPYFEMAAAEDCVDDISLKIENTFGLEISFAKELKRVEHSFTRYRARLRPLLFNTNFQKPVNTSFQWLSLEELRELPFSSGHRRILDNLQLTS